MRLRKATSKVNPGSARPDRLQIVYVLLCDRDGRPIAVEVFEGDFGDPSTVSAQISKLKQRFDLKHVYWSATAA